MGIPPPGFRDAFETAIDNRQAKIEASEAKQ
jgi:hypothetical protein